MSKERTRFYWYPNWDGTISRAKTEHDQLLLYKAIMPYALYGELPDEKVYPPELQSALWSIFDKVDTDRQAYRDTCSKNAENGSKGGKATAAKRSESSEM